MLSQKDIKQIEERGATLRQVKLQIEQFKTGFPWMKIVGPATPERGIKVLSPQEVEEAVAYYKGATIKGKSKFVPASGAASRMFKDMFAGLEQLEGGEDLKADAPGARLAAHIKDFAFAHVKFNVHLFGIIAADMPETISDAQQFLGNDIGRKDLIALNVLKCGLIASDAAHYSHLAIPDIAEPAKQSEIRLAVRVVSSV